MNTTCEIPGRNTINASQLVVTTRLQTPLGEMIAGATEYGICLLEFTEPERLEKQINRLESKMKAEALPGDSPFFDELNDQLESYFSKDRTQFDIPLVTSGTPFQERAWRALQKIPYGSTWSYAEQARSIHQPTAVRAVARANGDNRISIIIPCHRVIGSNGKLTGYGGGLWRKQRLLAIECAVPETELDIQ